MYRGTTAEKMLKILTITVSGESTIRRLRWADCKFCGTPTFPSMKAHTT